MKHRLRITIMILATALVVAGSTTGMSRAVAEAAAPAAAPRGCYSKYFCTWSGLNFVGSGPWNIGPVPSGACRALDPYASAYNNSRSWARVWEWTEDTNDGTRCGGRSMLIAPGHRAARFCDPAPGKGCFSAEGLGGR
jgi:Peptidase inhibitor family I36